MTKTFKILAGVTIGIVLCFIGYSVYLFSEKNKQRTANARAARWRAPEEPEDEEDEEDEQEARAEAEAAIKNILQNGN